MSGREGVDRRRTAFAAWCTYGQSEERLDELTLIP